MNLNLTGAELWERIRERSRQSIDERKAKETWYRLRLTVERKGEPVAGRAFFTAALVIEAHKPEASVSREEQSLSSDNYISRIRIRGSDTIELRAKPLTNSGYRVRVVDDNPEDAAEVEIESLKRTFRTC